ncbi:BglG family transcription antiterminator [Bacillus gobiensis]|uniref:PRD domain-containing protein n=1 Tax=Bacillus gobiensis TaxID=1441095 RepID=UPI003D1DB743
MKVELNDVVLHLLVNQSSSIESIEKDIKQKKHVIKEYINDINACLIKENKGCILLNDDNGNILISEATRESLYQMLKESRFINLDYISPEIRIHLILIKLLTDCNCDSLQDLADFVGVSKNTLLNDMKAVKEVLLSYSLQLEYSRSCGYQIHGSEFNMRKLLVTEAKKLLLNDFGAALFERKKMVDETELFFLKQRLIKMENELQVSLTDEQLEDLPFVLHLLIKRISEFQVEWTSELDDYDLVNTKEYQSLKEMFWGTGVLSEKDKLYMSLQVLSSSMLESALDLSGSMDLMLAVDGFLENLEGYLATALMNKTELKHKLILHLKPAIYRARLRLNMRNPLKEQFIAEFPSIYSIVSKSIHPIEEFARKSFLQEEIVYIAMLVQAWIYQTAEQRDHVFTALVVCRNGTSVSKLMLESLRGMFPHFHFIGAFAERNYKKHEHEVDFIFSTVPLNTSKKTFLVDPILTKENRKALKAELRKCIDKDDEKKAKELFYQLKEHIDIKDYQAIQNKITDFFKAPALTSVQTKHGETIFSFSSRHILFSDRDMTWEEAIETAMNPMMQRKSVKESYCRKVLELFQKESSRMMIGPGVYLPHASPGDGVEMEDFSLLICKHLVEMPDGGAAKMMVILSPKDYKHHVPTLLHLNEIFLDEAKADKIFQAKNEIDVLEVISPVSEKGVSAFD